jgi:hypothetical protein
MSQENPALFCAMLLAVGTLLDIAAKFPWLRREANPPSIKIAKKNATAARFMRAEEVDSDIW